MQVAEAPVQAQSVKIEPLKPFRGKNDKDIDSWIFSMGLCFKVEKYIPPTQRAIRAFLNLTADVTVWFRAKNPNLDALTWPELKVYL